MNDPRCACDGGWIPYALWVWPTTLASNLAIGAGLCTAFEQGREYENVPMFQAEPEWHPGHAITRASAQMEENGE